MIVLYPLVLFGAVALVWRGRHRAGGRGWGWFAAWTAAGALFTFSLLTGFSIGLFVLPFAATALFVVASRAPHVSEALGFLAGIGATLLLVAFLNRDYASCPEGGLSLPPGAPAGTSAHCGGLDPVPWLVAGVVAVGAACFAYALAKAAATSGHPVRGKR